MPRKRGNGVSGKIVLNQGDEMRVRVPVNAARSRGATGQFVAPVASGQSDPSSKADHETVPAQILHLVEWPDLWHPALDLSLRRIGRRGRAGQPLLPDARRQDRSDAAFRAPLGDLQRPRRGQPDPAGLAWLDPSYRRYAADRGRLQAAGVGKAACAEPHRYALRLPSIRLDARERQAPEGHRRLRAVDAG